MKATIEHRNSGYASPVYHPGPKPWGGKVFCTMPREGAKPMLEALKELVNTPKEKQDEFMYARAATVLDKATVE